MIHKPIKLYITNFIIAIQLLIILPAKAQERIQSIESGISLIGTSKQEMTSRLAEMGFNYNNGIADMLTYLKQSGLGSNTYSVGYVNQKVNAISWTEYFAHLQNIVSEIKSKGFTNYKSYDNSKMYGFNNVRRNIRLTLIVRETTNDIVVTIGKINQSKPIIVDKTVGSNIDLTSSSNQKYVCVSQKAFLNQLKNGITRQTNNFFTEGQLLSASKEKDGYVFVNLALDKQKVLTGWVCKCDLEIASDTIPHQINTIDKRSPLSALIKLDGENDNVKKVYNQPLVINALKDIMGASYNRFIHGFINQPITGETVVRHDVLFIRSFIMHAATTKAYLFMDLKTNKNMIYWIDTDDKVNVFGIKELTPNINRFIEAFLLSNKDFMDEANIKIFESLLKN